MSAAPARISSTFRNPFSSRFVRPGAAAFVFSGDLSRESAGRRLATVLNAWKKAGYRGQIIGPHGSGKSTLLADLSRFMLSGESTDVDSASENRQGRHFEIQLITLHDGARKLPCRLGSPELSRNDPAKRGVLMIDGYEQLSWWSRRHVTSFCRAEQWGLIVTAHAEVGLPTIFSTAVESELAWEIVRRFLHGGDPFIFEKDVREALSRHANNMREVLFGLYRLYEMRARSASFGEPEQAGKRVGLLLSP